MRDYFYNIASDLGSFLPAGHFFTATLSGENSDFVRFNKAKVLQAGSVSQNCFQADIMKGKKHATFSLMLCGQREEDLKSIKALALITSEHLNECEDDPFLLYSENPINLERMVSPSLPCATEVTRSIMDFVQGLDFVGIHAQGVTHRGFANSLGQRNFIEQETFNTDFSVYLSTDKAIKASCAGKSWDTKKFAAEIETIKSRLEILKRPAKTIEKGSYRAYLAPAAVGEIISLLKYGAFSEKHGQTKQSPFMMLRDDKKSLHSQISITENTKESISAPFQSNGFMKPDKVELVRNGKWMSGLISPRTAKEYALSTNGANGSESPESIEMGPGTLEKQNIAATLDTGLIINNLWYLNYSDRANCKMTGMTRFATFWVEKGEIVAPVNVMRFDDSVYSLLGSSLEAITNDRDFILDQSTYEERTTQSALLPGILVNEISFTL